MQHRKVFWAGIICLTILALVAVFIGKNLYRLSFYIDELHAEKAVAIKISRGIRPMRAKQLIEQARKFKNGDEFSLRPNPSRAAAFMWDEKYGFPREFNDIRPLRIEKVMEDEVWFTLYKMRDDDVFLCVENLDSERPKIILRHQRDLHFRFINEELIYPIHKLSETAGHYTEEIKN